MVGKMEAGWEAGDWKCTKILGKGSYGIVGLWENLKTKEKMAVKKFEVQAHPPPSEKVLLYLQERYVEEVSRMYDRIDNPHIVATVPIPPEMEAKVSGSGGGDDGSKDEDRSYEPVATTAGSCLPLLGMEYCSGGDLRQLLKRPENLNGLPEREIRRVLGHISNAISYLHENHIIHRDIKPENIVIQRGASGEAIYKLSDLGFAKDLSGNDSLCSTQLGTLPYLAPEIYIGEKYDKTVDYWSFGLITFEIMCGMRPFLPGESPAAWIPLAQKKEKDVIAIFRNENGDIEYAKDIPYNTHLSPLLRKCLVAWLPSMLQVDPARRGKYVLTPEQRKSGCKEEANALTRLRNMLNTKFLEIHAYPEKLVVAIGRTITVAQVQDWISKETGISEANQLLLTAEGDRLTPDELAIKYYESDKKLYLLSKLDLGKDLSVKIKLSKPLTTFLSPEWKASRDVAKNRAFWFEAIFFVQKELWKMERLTNAIEALSLYYKKTCTQELDQLDRNIDKAWHSLQSVIELDEKLNQVESRYAVPEIEGEACEPIKAEGEELRRVSRQSLDNRPTELELGTLPIQSCRDLYQKVLQLYDTWRNPDTENVVIQAMELLVRFVCQFLSNARQNLIKAASANMKLLNERMRGDEELKENIQIILSKLNSLIDQVFAQRLDRQKKILSAGFPRKSPPALPNGFRKDTSPTMTQSLICLGADAGSSSRLTNGNSDSFTMTQSLCVNGSRRSSFSPDFTKLMEESISIQEALNNSVAQVESLLTENAELQSNYFEN